MPFFGIQTKPVQRSLNALASIGAVEYVAGSSKPGQSFYPFTVKLKPDFAHLCPDRNPFICHATKLHETAANFIRISTDKKSE